MSNIHRARMTDITLDEKLERMLMNWAKPERCGVMLPGTNMTCDTAAVAIRAALSASPSQVAPANPAQVTEALRQMLRLFDDQGNLTADFRHLQSAINNGYRVLSATEGR